MGAEVSFTSFDGKLSVEELRKEFYKYQEQCAYESGHSYSGQLNMCNGLKVSDVKFDDDTKAKQYIIDHTSKWENALAVKCNNKWLVGGICSS